LKRDEIKAAEEKKLIQEELNKEVKREAPVVA
jgi:hypothetical protein